MGSACSREATPGNQPDDAQIEKKLHSVHPYDDKKSSSVEEKIATPIDAASPDKLDVSVAVFSVRPYMWSQLNIWEKSFTSVKVIETPLSLITAPLAKGYTAVCAFVNDDLSAEVIDTLAANGVKVIAMRCAGFDRVDLAAAAKHNIKVVRVPAYSPYAVAEHALALMLGLNRQINKANVRVRQGNYDLSGLVGFDMHGKTVGVVGSGKIGQCLMSILIGMGCDVITFDPYENQATKDMGVKYVPLDELLERSHVVSLHCPLFPGTHHIINKETIAKMKPGAMLINTSRGGLIDTKAVIEGLDNRTIGSLGIDVYEEEAGQFFTDMSMLTDNHPGASLPDAFDPQLALLSARPNVIITPHMAFLTQDALVAIAETTVKNLTEFSTGATCTNEVKA